MAELMKKSTKTLRTFHKGESVSGTITKLTPQEILVNIDGKTEALVLEKDKRILRTLLSTLHVGDRVDVGILSPESDLGYPIVSLRRFIDTHIWKQLEDAYQANQQIDVTIREMTKGGYLVDTGYGVTGFLPNSQLQSAADAPQNLVEDAVGVRIKVYILELQKQAKKLVFSKRPVLTKEQFEEMTKGIKVGQKISAIISNITPFGAFATIQISGKKGTVDGLVHISEVSWDKVENVSDLFVTGQKIDAVVLGIDAAAKRIDLSLKRATGDPFETTIKQFPVDTKVTGTVLRVSSNGVSIQLTTDEGTVEAFMKKDKIPPSISYTAGDKVTAVITDIDKAKHRILVVPVLTEKPMGYR